MYIIYMLLILINKLLIHWSWWIASTYNGIYFKHSILIKILLIFRSTQKRISKQQNGEHRISVLKTYIISLLFFFFWSEKLKIRKIKNMHKYNLNFPISRTIFTYFRPTCRNRLLKNFSNGDRNIPKTKYTSATWSKLYTLFFFSFPYLFISPFKIVNNDPPLCYTLWIKHLKLARAENARLQRTK